MRSGPIFLRLATAAFAVFFSLSAYSASPTNGSLSSGDTAPVTFYGTPAGGSSPEGETTCVEGVNCDTFTLTLNGQAADWSGKIVKVRLDWLAPATDYDLYIHKDSVTGPEVSRSAEGATTFEATTINPAVAGTGVFVVHVVYFAATAADQYKGTATVADAPVATTEPPPPQSSATPPTYDNFAAPAALGSSAGEPSIGTNWKTGNAMFIASLKTLRVTFDDSVKPATATWVNKSAVNTSKTSFDPILYTDSKQGRTFVSQLLPDKTSLMSFSDDDGETWTPSQGSGINSGVDHQTIGSGPFKPGIPGRGPLPTSTYPNAVYYASQDIGLAELALSQDGGLTFGVASPMYNLTECTGIHGHIKVAPNGDVYVPNKNCTDHQALIVSEDNGLTFSIRKVPTSLPGESDPSVAVGPDGTIYFAYSNGDGHARVTVSRDAGKTWTNDQDLGFNFGIQNSVFPAAVAGDGDRASVFFLGTTAPGTAGTGTDMSFNGVWYGYVSTTYDRGATWVTVQATGTDPVQRGVVCTFGTTCPSGTRNLLDFNDLQVDAKGRPVAAMADGCITDACKQGVDRSGPNGVPDGRVDSYDNDGARFATIIRQSGGRTLFAANDEPAAPSSVSATAGKDQGMRVVNVTWRDNSTNETAFVLERSTSALSDYTTVATLAANTTSYTDRAVAAKTTYYYRVRATNANGSSANSNTAKAYVK